jgi:phage-related protein
MPESKRIVWLGTTLADLGQASEKVRDTMGGALRAAQEGGSTDDVVRLRDHLREVMEVREDDEVGTHRLMYTVVIDDNVYVLDFFQKKSKSGIATPKADLDRIAQRLAQAKRLAAASLTKER